MMKRLVVILILRERKFLEFSWIAPNAAKEDLWQIYPIDNIFIVSSLSFYTRLIRTIGLLLNILLFFEPDNDSISLASQPVHLFAVF
jgi:hypothetical protein